MREQGAEHLTAGRRPRVGARPRKASTPGGSGTGENVKHQGTSAIPLGSSLVRGPDIDGFSTRKCIFVSCPPPSRRPLSGGLWKCLTKEPYPPRALSAPPALDLALGPSVRDPARPALETGPGKLPSGGRGEPSSCETKNRARRWLAVAPLRFGRLRLTPPWHHRKRQT